MNESQLEDMPVVPLNLDSAAVLADLVAIYQDLMFVVDCYERLEALLREDERDSVMVRALWTAALVAYARCFASGKRFGLSEDSFVGLQGEVTQLHRWLMDMRNKHIAHSVNPFEVVKVGAFLSPRTAPEKKVEGIAHLGLQHTAGTEQVVHDIIALARTLRARIEQLVEVQTRVVQEEAEQCDIETLYSLPRMRVTAPGSDQAKRARRLTD